MAIDPLPFVVCATLQILMLLVLVGIIVRYAIKRRKLEDSDEDSDTKGNSACKISTPQYYTRMKEIEKMFDTLLMMAINHPEKSDEISARKVDLSNKIYLLKLMCARSYTKDLEERLDDVRHWMLASWPTNQIEMYELSKELRELVRTAKHAARNATYSELQSMLCVANIFK